MKKTYPLFLSLYLLFFSVNCLEAAEAKARPTPERKKATLYFKKGIHWNEKGNATRATKASLKATKIDPTYSDALFNLGILYTKKGDIENAIKAYQFL